MATIYEELGGAAAMNAAVDIFYRKVLSDDRISKYFEGVDMDRQAQKQKAFLTMVLGGPNAYTGKDMRTAHAHLVARGLNDMHFDAVVEIAKRKAAGELTDEQAQAAVDLLGAGGTPPTPAVEEEAPAGPTEAEMMALADEGLAAVLGRSRR